MGAEEEVRKSEDELVEEMEKELENTGDIDGFLEEFEKELGDTDTKNAEEDNDLLMKLDDIVNEASGETAEDQSDEADVDTIGDLGETSEAPAEEIQTAEAETEYSEIEASEPEKSNVAAAAVSEEETGKKGKKRVKKERGFLGRLLHSLFGNKEGEDALAENEEELQEAAASPEGDISDENMQILKQLEGSSGTAESGGEEAGGKKKKKEKKPKAKKAKPKKEKKPKVKKAKKPKPPKEPDNTPPLPKVPVFLTLVMAASFVALVLIGTNLFDYSLSFKTAAGDYSSGDFEAAYQEVEGLSVSDSDADTYSKYEIMAIASAEYNSYKTFMDADIYDMALDSLIRAVGRCDKYQEEAKAYGCALELSTLQDSAEAELSSFGITPDRALELYRIEDRSEYSVEINSILASAGLK